MSSQAVGTTQIDNERSRVTEWRFAPGAATGFHRHEYDYVIVPGRLLPDFLGREIGCMRLYAFRQAKWYELAAAYAYAAGAIGVSFAGDLITLFLYWELMALFSTVIVWCGGTPEARAAGVRAGLFTEDSVVGIRLLDLFDEVVFDGYVGFGRSLNRCLDQCDFDISAPNHFSAMGVDIAQFIIAHFSWGCGSQRLCLARLLLYLGLPSRLSKQ